MPDEEQEERTRGKKKRKKKEEEEEMRKGKRRRIKRERGRKRGKRKGSAQDVISRRENCVISTWTRSRALCRRKFSKWEKNLKEYKYKMY